MPERLQEHVDSSGAYDAIPLASTLDVKSKDRTDGLQYRAGLHYVRLSSGAFCFVLTLLCHAPGTLREAVSNMDLQASGAPASGF